VPAGNGAEPPDPTPARIRSLAAVRGFPMGEGAIPIPTECAAACRLECDIWAGEVTCGTAQWSVWGGFTSMAGMALDGKGAELSGAQAVGGTAKLRWGYAPDGRFCSAVNDGHWNWEICASPDQRESVRHASVRPRIPEADLVDCPNTGC
jgi:hypothetical protein